MKIKKILEKKHTFFSQFIIVMMLLLFNLLLNDVIIYFLEIFLNLELTLTNIKLVHDIISLLVFVPLLYAIMLLKNRPKISIIVEMSFVGIGIIFLQSIFLPVFILSMQLMAKPFDKKLDK